MFSATSQGVALNEDETLLFVALGPLGIIIIDVSDPTNPMQVANLTIPSMCKFLTFQFSIILTNFDNIL
jgi:hypothetical protein